MKPFQVICVFIGSEPEYRKEEMPMTITVGSEYTVISKVTIDGLPMYELSHQLDVCYPVEFFATLPSTTEEIAVECEQEAIIYQM